MYSELTKITNTESIEKLPNQSWVKDLISEQGPLLSLFTTGTGLFLWRWVDCDSCHNRWFVFPVSQKELDNLVSGDISLYHLIRKVVSTNITYTVDRGQRGEIEKAKLHQVDDQLPVEYYPDELFSVPVLLEDSYYES